MKGCLLLVQVPTRKKDVSGQDDDVNFGERRICTKDGNGRDESVEV
jgi:hypothetical protein